MNSKMLLATYAAKIVTIHDRRKQLENEIAALYREARKAGVNRHDLKSAVQNYHTANAGVVPDDVKSDDNDDNDMDRHLAIIDAALARVRVGPDATSLR
jgi:hypothetical protein